MFSHEVLEKANSDDHKESPAMSKISRRSFLTVSAAASGSSILSFAQAAEIIPGFDQTKTGYDTTEVWKPFSNRKVRVGIVGHGVCQFGLQFGLQDHPNVELVAVSDLFPDRCADMARKAKCSKTYPSLEEIGGDGQGRFNRGHLLCHRRSSPC